MKIGYYTQLYIPDTGGAEIFLNRLATSIQLRNHKVVVIAPRRKGESTTLNYPVVRTLKPFSKRFFLHHSVLPLLYAFFRYRFELLHCHGEYHVAYVARTFKKLTGIPYVVRPLGGGFASISQNNRLKVRTRKALKAADGLIAQGKFLRSQIEAYGVAEEKIVTIYNGVDPAEIVVEGRNPRSKPFILYIGGLRHVKGYDVLLRAFSLISKELAPIQLVMAGNRKEWDQFIHLRNELGLSEREVDFVGVLDRKQLPQYFRYALLYVCPFRKAPFSNANLEAMMAGCPLVATNVGGNTEQVRDGKEGVLVPSDDYEKLANAIKQICLSPDMRTKMSKWAKQRSKAFTWKRMVDEYEKFYQSIL